MFPTLLKEIASSKVGAKEDAKLKKVLKKNVDEFYELIDMV